MLTEMYRMEQDISIFKYLGYKPLEALQQWRAA